MPAIIIHIGLHKTGTTSIQKSLSSSRNYLWDNGIFYPATGKFDAQHGLASSILADRADACLDRSSFGRQMREFANAGASTIVISSEMFSEGIDYRALDILDAIFAEVRIVMYVRCPDYLLESAYAQQVLQNGEIRKINDYKPYFIDFWGHVKKFDSDSSNRNLVVREYNGGDVVPDFWSYILNLPYPKIEGIHENLSVSAVGCEVVRRLNTVKRVHGGEVIKRIRSICAELGGPYIKPPAGNMFSVNQRLRIREASQEKNRMLRELYGIEFAYSDIQGPLDINVYAEKIMNRLDIPRVDRDDF